MDKPANLGINRREAVRARMKRSRDFGSQTDQDASVTTFMSLPTACE